MKEKRKKNFKLVSYKLTNYETFKYIET